MNTIDYLQMEQMREDIPSFKAGDTIKVHLRVREGDKERIQIFQGDVIAKRNNGLASTFTVRKVSFGIGVERVFPLHSPFLDKVEIVKTGKVRRGKLYYLRNLKGKAAKIEEKKTW